MNNSIEIKGLNKFYGKKQALFDVNLSIQQGMFGLLGRNGAGKTTLMKTLATLLQKKNGEITVCGVPIENAKEIRRIIGYLPQEFSMYPSMKVGEAMEDLAILSGRCRERRTGRHTPQKSESDRALGQKGEGSFRRHETPSWNRPGAAQ